MAVASSTSPVETTLPSDVLYIFADIQTDSEQGNILLQLAAVTLTGEQFNIFINPQISLPEACTKFLGLYFKNKALYRNGKFLPSFTIFIAFNQFKTWLSKFNKQIILVFQKGFSFDCYVLAHFLVRFNISLPENVLVTDTLPYFRIHYKPPIFPDHKITTLAQHFKTLHEHAHDALSDSLALKGICQQLVITDSTSLEEIFKNSFGLFQNIPTFT